MELFTVNRYDEETVADDPKREEKILQKLVKKAEKRKKKLEKSQQETINTLADSVNEDNNNTESEDAAGKTKKIKLENEEQEQIADDGKETEEQNQIESKTSDELKVLGNDVFQKKQKIDMVLPSWLAYPTIIANKINIDETKETVSEIKFLSPKIKDALNEMKIEKLFPVQNEVVPWILNAYTKPPPFRPRDICVSAPTGSGKTLAFAIPIVQILSERVERKIRALIVLPVNELALQVYKVFNSLTSKTNLSVCLLSKSCLLPAEQKKLVEHFNGKYYSKVDIVITTPGRLVEHIHSTKGFSLENLKFLVIDEADRIMEQVHHNWLYHLDNHVRSTSDMLLSGKSIPLSLNDLKNIAYEQPHKMLFSATLSQDPEKLQNLRLFQPKLFTSVVASPEELMSKLKEKIESVHNEETTEVRGEFIGKYTTPAELTEKYCITESQLKPLTLYTLIKENSWKKFLCFTNSAESAHRLSFVLVRLFGDKSIAEISANLKPSRRTEILNLFAIGKIKGLISSDALARGIDIPDIDIVISYELPRHIKTYIHRIGRTARAGRLGTAITLLSTKELTTFSKILAAAGKEPMNEIKIESNLEVEYAKEYSKILNDLKKQLEREKKVKVLYKNLIARKAIPTAEQKSAKMSLMERLQVQANEIVADQLEKTIRTQERKSNKRNKIKSIKEKK